ncbi:MAG TPA: DUF1207 domain-containing protein [Gemmatimonadales bacterium]|nr:DUF1207 domain-containing protein [Gemmatimonadales bacterium]
MILTARAALRALLSGAALLLGLVWEPELAAQTRLFPDVPSFELPQASPRVTGFTGRLLAVGRGDSRFGSGTEGEAAVAEDFPLLALRRGPRPVTLSFGVGVYGRFSLDDPKSSLISNDWTVGFTAYALRPRWEAALQLYHESSHLGDEYAETFDAPRLDWTREVAAAWVAYRTGPWRASAGVSQVLVDELRLPGAGASLALDFRGSAARVVGEGIRPIAGVYWDAYAATDWTISTSVKVGVALAGGRQGRELRLSLIGHSGLSTQRQFFRARNRYLGAEVQFEL